MIEIKKSVIDRPYHLLTLSAKTQPALDQLIELYTKQLPEEDLADISFTANTGRAHFPYRVTVVAQTRDELLQYLQKGDYLIGEASDKPPKITFIFTGQTIVNAELMETSPVFKEAMERSHGLYEYALFELVEKLGNCPRLRSRRRYRRYHRRNRCRNNHFRRRVKAYCCRINLSN